jgi:hypothetical protein
MDAHAPGFPWRMNSAGVMGFSLGLWKTRYPDGQLVHTTCSLYSPNIGARPLALEWEENAFVL